MAAWFLVGLIKLNDLEKILGNTLSLGICGLGTVGAGVINILQRSELLINRRASNNIQVVRAAARSFRDNCDLKNIAFSHDVMDVVNDPNVDVVVELIGGTTLAKEIVEAAISNGKHVVTANKALIAEYGEQLLKAASDAGVSLMFEAAVAGGIPIIRAITEGLAANQYQTLAGIINGTGNYILTEMLEKERSFEDALADAQALGYAEADPTYDVEGIDAAQKLVILAALAFGVPIDYSSAYVEGISAIKTEDLKFAKQLGYGVKHLAIASQTEQGLELRAHPALVKESHLIASVNGVMNAVFVSGDAVGPTLHYGPGAGSEPTASSVLADVVAIARANAANAEPLDFLAQVRDTAANISVKAIEQVNSAFYLRLMAENKPGALSKITQCLGEQEISVDAVMQDNKSSADVVPVVLTTSTTSETVMRSAIEQLEQLDVSKEPVVSIRIADLD